MKMMTFNNFQKLSIETLTAGTVLIFNPKLYEALRTQTTIAWSNANDNETEFSMKVKAFLMFPEYLDMLRCWVECNKDMVLAKLTYEEGLNNGT